MYGSGSTYFGGAGTASFQHDICDLCWGSGDESKPFDNLLEREQRWRRRVDTAEVDALSKRLGQSVEPTHLEAIADIIAAAGRKRKLPVGGSPFWWSLYCDIMASQLRSVAASYRQRMNEIKEEAAKR